MPATVAYYVIPAISLCVLMVLIGLVVYLVRSSKARSKSNVIMTSTKKIVMSSPTQPTQRNSTRLSTNSNLNNSSVEDTSVTVTGKPADGSVWVKRVVGAPFVA